MIFSFRLVIFLSFTSILVGLLTFLRGFMPNKVGLPGFAATTTKQALKQGLENGRFLSHERLIIVLIDALRADFVLGKTKYMKYTRGLIEQHETVPLLVKSDAPTVTLPRIKAITTGGIPGFVDVVLNFDSKSLNEDNLLEQFRRANKNIVFFGDDTWLRLFPDTFQRSDGTTSFFVSDYTEVDKNVSRHLQRELEQLDWDVMILHYLGLDHIGHLAGPSSPLVAPKLHEMDQVVEIIHKHLLKVAEDGAGDSLMLLCGDHGMTDQGGHGGASYSEVTTPAVFISTKFRHGQGTGFDKDLTVNQFDITPTLALLFGLPIPLNSFGMLIPHVFRDASVADLVSLHQENAEQLWKVVDWTMKGATTEYMRMEFESVQSSMEAWKTSPNDPESGEWKRQAKSLLQKYQNVMKKMQGKVTSSLTDYDLHALAVGIIILWLVLLTTLLHINSPACGHVTIDLDGVTGILAIAAVTGPLLLHAIACTSHWGSRWLCADDFIHRMTQGLFFLIMSVFVFMILLRLYGILVLDNRVKDITKERRSLCGSVLVVGTGLQCLSLLSSSFIEEEHQTWYFFTITIHIVAVFQVASQRAKQKMKCGDSVDESTEKYTLLKERSGPTDSKTRLRAGAFASGFPSKNSEHIGLADMSNIQLAKSQFLLINAQETHDLGDKKSDMSSTRKQRSELCSNHAGYMFSLLPPAGRAYVGILAIAVLGRFARPLNQTGNKWLDQPDVGDWLVRPEQKLVLSLLVVVAMAVMFVVRLPLHRTFSRVMLVLGLIGVYAFRAANGVLWIPDILTTMLSEKGVAEAWWVFTCCALIFTESLYSYITSKQTAPNKGELLWEKLLSGWILFIALLLRPHNMLLVAVLTVQERLVFECLIKHISLSLPSLTLYYLWMGQAAFFYQGNSNSVSTVDVSAGYVGLTEYQPVLIGTLMVLSTYAGLIFWFIGLAKTVQLKSHVRTAVGHTLLLSRALPLSLFTALLFCQRYHLFVWTVFSPKLLYEGMLSVIVAVFSLALISVS